MNPCPNIRDMWTSWPSSLAKMRVGEGAVIMEAFESQWFWKAYYLWGHRND